MINEIQLNIAKQINARELKFAKFQLSSGNNNDITIKKGKKALKIRYNEGTDMYDLEYITWSNYDNIKRRKVDGIFFDQLQEIIQEFFNFEYVMHNFVRQ